ncbi:zinc finger HIT domain-containing protein 2 [Haematobia irritans]|uniref:zinc finger HIT domain-containing protein 2 n=1 Tax=Haematobia irritans TaxID=7368 RepID=UPI003F50D3D8
MICLENLNSLILEGNKMSTANDDCQICNKDKFKYTCPRCNVLYCSLDCYKSKEHLKCSEAFYKQCIQDELQAKAGNSENKEDMRKIYDILKRIRETDAGIPIEDFDQDSLDSDDDDANIEECDEEEEDITQIRDNIDGTDQEELDIAERLKDVDINDADEVWENLTQEERDEFKKLLASGEIMKLIPEYKPWWLKNSTKSKIVDMSSQSGAGACSVPAIYENIPAFASICSKEPAPCIHYNLWNIISSYCCTARYFNGEHLTNPNEAAAFLINLSTTLKYGTNFEEVEDAIVSVQMEALTTGNGAAHLMPNGEKHGLIVETPEQLRSDAREVMSKHQYKLAALSESLKLFQLTKNILKKANKKDTEFQKLFALSSGMEELTKAKVLQIIKKLEFYLSYVNRDSEKEK